MGRERREDGRLGVEDRARIEARNVGIAAFREAYENEAEFTHIEDAVAAAVSSAFGAGWEARAVAAEEERDELRALAKVYEARARAAEERADELERALGKIVALDDNTYDLYKASAALNYAADIAQSALACVPLREEDR